MKTLGIIGCGAFTRFMLPHLQPYFKISVWNRSGIAEGSLPEGVVDTPLEEVAACEVVVLSIAVPGFVEILPRIGEYIQPGALVLDVASVKVRPIELMLEYLPPHCEIVGTHPLFGPESGKGGLAGLRVALCKARTERFEQVKEFLADKLGLTIIECTPEQHDLELAWVQGLPHFVVRALNVLQPPDSEFATLAYQHLRKVEELLKHDSLALFMTIQKENPFATEVRHRFLEELSAIEKQITDSE